MQEKQGNVRVGRITFVKGKAHHPRFEGFTPIVVMTPSSQYGHLGPYVLQDEKGRIMENIWQFSKLYERVPASVQYYSRFDKRVIWSHPAETHYDSKQKKPTPAYWAWRSKGMQNKFAVRYPVGFNHRHSGIVGSIDPAVSAPAPFPSSSSPSSSSSLSVKAIEPVEIPVEKEVKTEAATQSLEILDYISARKRIYVPVYCRLVRKEKDFLRLKQRLSQGENLLILEVDGPHTESMPYYMAKYGVRSDWIEADTILVTQESINILLNDARHPFGHGYCLGIELLQLAY